MFLTNLFNFKKKCSHDKITPDMECGYCPDCGEFIRNDWYIARCSCCGVKLKAMLKNGRVQAQYQFCSNCGGHDYTIEKLDKINFIDINYAVLVKTVIKKDLFANRTTQCWQEKTSELPKLTVQYL